MVKLPQKLASIAALPHPAPGQRIGLFGGSFNPAHNGHVHVSHHAITALGLDALWWLVASQNPLKPASGMAKLEDRVAGARIMVRDRRIKVGAFELALGTRYTIDTVRALKRRFPTVRFVLVIGADNLIELSRWKDWTALLRAIPIAVYPRPGYTLKARNARAARRFAHARLDTTDAKALLVSQPPALVFLGGPEHTASATAIRSQRRKPRGGRTGQRAPARRAEPG